MDSTSQRNMSTPDPSVHHVVNNKTPNPTGMYALVLAAIAVVTSLQPIDATATLPTGNNHATFGSPIHNLICITDRLTPDPMRPFHQSNNASPQFGAPDSSPNASIKQQAHLASVNKKNAKARGKNYTN